MFIKKNCFVIRGFLSHGFKLKYKETSQIFNYYVFRHVFSEMDY